MNSDLAPVTKETDSALIPAAAPATEETNSMKAIDVFLDAFALSAEELESWNMALSLAQADATKHNQYFDTAAFTRIRLKVH